MECGGRVVWPGHGDTVRRLDDGSVPTAQEGTFQSMLQGPFLKHTSATRSLSVTEAVGGRAHSPERTGHGLGQSCVTADVQAPGEKQVHSFPMGTVSRVCAAERSVQTHLCVGRLD